MNPIRGGLAPAGSGSNWDLDPLLHGGSPVFRLRALAAVTNQFGVVVAESPPTPYCADEFTSFVKFKMAATGSFTRLQELLESGFSFYLIWSVSSSAVFRWFGATGPSRSEPHPCGVELDSGSVQNWTIQQSPTEPT